MEDAKMKDSALPFDRHGRSSLVLGLKIATIFIAALAIFHRDLAIIANDALQTEFMSHILAVPFLFAYGIYRKRKMLRAVIPLDAQNQPKETKHLPTIAGILLSAISVLLYYYGTGALEYHLLALPIFAAGLTLIMFNYQTLKQLALPIAFLILLIPRPSQILYGLSLTLSVISAILLLTITEKIRARALTKTFTQCQHYPKRSNNPQNFCSSCGRLLKYPEAQLKRQDLVKMMAIAIAVALLLRASAIAQYWQLTEMWTQIAILISQNGDKLIAMTFGLLMLVITFYALEIRTERKMNAAAYQKLSKLDKRLIDVVHETEKTPTPTLNAITTQYQSITGETIDKEKLFQKLVEAEKTRIIKSHIVNQYDEPIQIWKTQIDFKTRIPLGSKMIPILLLTGIVMNAISLFFFTLLDQVVHKDLYRYGLQYNYEWAGQYWTYSGLIISLLAVAIIVNGISMAFILVRVRTHKIYSTKFPSLLLVMGIVTASLCVFFFNRLDYVIQNNLYRYGLQFNYEWAGQYWIYARLTMGLLGVGIATSGTSIVLILTSAQLGEKRLSLGAPPLEIDRTKLICSVMFSAGVIALVSSINYNSSNLAFIGLGLVFWGAILLYIRPEKYVKETLLSKTTLSSLASLNQALRELGYKGKGVYLPPKYFNDFESSKVYFSAQEHTKLPSPEQIQVQGDKMFLQDPEGILITPPGMELTRLFEETLGTSFTRVDLKYLEQNITRLLIEDLEIAQNLEIETKSGRVHIKIENSIYKNICREARKFSNICHSLGCPICSAIACALTKATGKPIIIEKDLTSEDGQTIDIQYRLLEEPSQ